MAKIRKRKLIWNASASAHVTGYKVYWSSGRNLDYHAPCVNVGNVTAVVIPDDLAGFSASSPDLSFGVTAVDSEGNESDMTIIDGAGLFRAPAGPSGIRMENEPGGLPQAKRSTSNRISIDKGKNTALRDRQPEKMSFRSEPRSDVRIEETKDALVKIETLLSRFFQEE
jgi:hypothetical protein